MSAQRFFEWREAPAAEFAVLGDPVAHSLSPQMWSAGFSRVGLDARYVRIRVPREELAEALDHLRGRGYQGMNLTVPLKEAGFSWCAQPSEEAARAGAVNTVRLASGEGWLTDIEGFRRLIEGASGPVLLLGAGGTSRAAALALQGREWAVWNRTPSKAVALAEEFGGRAMDTLDPSGFGVVANLTSVSVTGEALPLDWSGCGPETLAVDAGYRPDGQLSPFLQAAKSARLRVRDGRPMLAAQGAAAFRILTGRDAPDLEAVMMGAL